MANVQDTLKILLENPVLIYGAGTTGRRVAVCLKELGVDVVGIAVSSAYSNVKVLGDYPVKVIERWQNYAGEAVVMVASIHDQETIIQTCRSYGFENIVVLDQASHDMFFSTYFKPILTRHGVDLSGESIQIGNGRYLNPFTQLDRGSALYVDALGDFVVPSLFDEWADINEGTYELGNVTVFPNDVVFDLGANHGVFSVYAASRGAEVYAFEPTPELKTIIERQSELNNGTIHLAPYAVSNVCGKTQFYISNSTSVNGLTEHDQFLSDEVVSTITVDQITIDEFVKRNNISRVDFIKADIEGAERLMLQGAQETLKKFAPKLALCTYHLPDDKDVMTDLILKANPDYKIEYKWKKLYAYV